jgi:hypothetical protein
MRQVIFRLVLLLEQFVYFGLVVDHFHFLDFPVGSAQLHLRVARVMLPLIEGIAQVRLHWLKTVLHVSEDPSDEFAQFDELSPAVKHLGQQIAVVLIWAIALQTSNCSRN